MMASKYFCTLLFGALITAGVLPLDVAAAESDWQLIERTLPVPAGASQALQDQLAATPQPDVAERKQSAPRTREQWDAAIAAGAANRWKLVDRRGTACRRGQLGLCHVDGHPDARPALSPGLDSLNGAAQSRVGQALAARQACPTT